MKIINKIFIAALLVICLPLTAVYSYDSNVQTVGFDSGEIDGVDGPNSIVPENFQSDEDSDNNSQAESPDNPTEYDPDNPYAEWER